MGLFSRLFKPSAIGLPLKWDMHNHILPGIDDGSKNMEQSLAMARQLIDLGYERIVATPHIMSDYYPNTPELIREKQKLLAAAISANGLELGLGVAAEYYMDEVLYEKVKNREELLCFQGNHVLVETSFLNKPVFFRQLFFEMKTAGYMPVLAHPERYVYFHDHYEDAETVLASGVKFQINLMSLASYYSPQAKKFAQWLISKGHYHFLGTDAHKEEHLKIIRTVFASKIFSKIDFDRVENTR